MKIYLDVSCLNRPFDDQSQTRIRLETEGISEVLKGCARGDWTHVSSKMATIEIDAIPDAERRSRVRLLLPARKFMLKLSNVVYARAADLELLGFKAADAVHVAAAETLKADVLLSCDDRLCARAWRCRDQLKVRVANPLDWLKEVSNDDDA